MKLESKSDKSDQLADITEIR